MGISDNGSRRLYILDVLINIGILYGIIVLELRVWAWILRIIVLVLRVGVGIFREIGWIWCRIKRLGLGLVLRVGIEVFLHVAVEPRRMAADTPQTT